MVWFLIPVALTAIAAAVWDERQQEKAEAARRAAEDEAKEAARQEYLDQRRTLLTNEWRRLIGDFLLQHKHVISAEFPDDPGFYSMQSWAEEPTPDTFDDMLRHLGGPAYRCDRASDLVAWNVEHERISNEINQLGALVEEIYRRKLS